MKTIQRRKVEGSMTIMMSLSLLLVISILCSLLEMTRIWGYQSIFKTSKEVALTSLMASYNSPLWENYHVLAIPAGIQEGENLDLEPLEWRMLNYGNTSLDAGKASNYQLNLFSGRLWDAHIMQYSVLTDKEGEIFRKQACQYAGNHLPIQAIDLLVHKTQEDNSLIFQEEDILDKGQDAIEQAGEMKEEIELGSDADGKQDEREEGKEENEAVKNNDSLVRQEAVSEDDREERQEAEDPPIEFMETMKKAPILELVLPKGQEVSSKYLQNVEEGEVTANEGASRKSDIQSRRLYCGDDELVKEGLTNRVLYAAYLQEHFGSYGKPLEGRALNYELEEILMDKGRDQDNLKGVVGRLLLLREGVNFIYLSTHPKKTAMAQSVAMGLVGWTGVAPLVEAVKWLVVLAWAYVESIIDLQVLMDQGEVPLVKTDSTWQTDLYHLGKGVAKGGNADLYKAGKATISYEQYLLILLGIETKQKVNIRTLQLVEENLEKMTGHRVYLDKQVSAVEGQLCFEGEELFAKFITLPITKSLGYSKVLTFKGYEY